MKPKATALTLLFFCARGAARRGLSGRSRLRRLRRHVGGVIAAVPAARLGKIVKPGRHLGGMTAGGLSWTDVGNSDRVSAVGGMAREVYERMGAHYGNQLGALLEPAAGMDVE